MAAPGKQYGLILPRKGTSKDAALPRPSVFGDDSDDETTVGESLLKEAAKKKVMKQTQLEMQKALEQDSSVYEYDSVYDDIQKQKEESNKRLLGSADRKPKYITQLMRAVEARKKEQERREERKIQKEREQEGEQFKDKEAFVTTAYRQKLQERKEEEEKERREAALEAALDVKKQKDLSGFYRHLLNQTVGEESLPEPSSHSEQKMADIPAEDEAPSPCPAPRTVQESGSHSDTEASYDQKAEFSKPPANSSHSKRHYRHRSPSSESAEEREDPREERGRTREDREEERRKERRSHRDRDRERDDKSGSRKEDRERRKHREEDRSRGRRDREDERSRGWRDREERADRRERRDSSPRDRGRERNGMKDRDRGRDRERDRVKDREHEREKDREKERKSRDSEKDRNKVEDEKPRSREEQEKTKGEDEEGENNPGVDSGPKPSKFAKRSSDVTVTSARERYLARQLARSAAKTYIEKEED
ncbi:nuclear speckle splicing regulatory protein 1 isoform X1 [Arapaima gigas]